VKPVIQVRNLSKRYRIGLKESRKDTFVGQVGAVLRAPIDNFRKLRSLGKFKDDDESVFWALRDINFDVQQGEVLGIIGHNGAGKSTLLKILSRITEPTAGEIRIRGRVSSLLEVGTGFHPDLTGRENIYMNGTILGMTRREIDSKFDEIVDFSGVEKYIDTPVKRYSSGMTVRLAFSVAAHLEPEILIIDEVLAVGDAEFQKKCLGKMKDVSGEGRTVLFVSHNMGAVKSLCSKGLLLKGGQVLFTGVTDETIKRYIHNRVQAEIKGIVSKDMRRFHSGEVFISQVGLTDSEGNLTEDLYYQEDMHITIKMDVQVQIKNALLDIQVTSVEGLPVAHHMNTFSGKKTQTLTPGGWTAEVNLRNTLAPGEYSMTIGIHHPNGMTIEYVEDVYPFTVLKAGRDESLNYPYDWVHGYHHLEGYWNFHENNRKTQVHTPG